MIGTSSLFPLAHTHTHPHTIVDNYSFWIYISIYLCLIHLGNCVNLRWGQITFQEFCYFSHSTPKLHVRQALCWDCCIRLFFAELLSCLYLKKKLAKLMQETTVLSNAAQFSAAFLKKGIMCRVVRPFWPRLIQIYYPWFYLYAKQLGSST